MCVVCVASDMCIYARQIKTLEIGILTRFRMISGDSRACWLGALGRCGGHVLLAFTIHVCWCIVRGALEGPDFENGGHRPPLPLVEPPLYTWQSQGTRLWMIWVHDVSEVTARKWVCATWHSVSSDVKSRNAAARTVTVGRWRRRLPEGGGGAGGGEQ